MRWKLSILILAAFASSVWLVTAQKGAGRNGEPVGLSESPGQRLPAYQLTYTDQREVAPDELTRGRVLLVFLTTSCKPCVEQVGIISQLQAASPGDPKIYGVSFERANEVGAFASEHDLKFPLLLDPGAGLTRTLEIHYFPSLLLVEGGEITKVWRGVTRDEAELRRRLNVE